MLGWHMDILSVRCVSRGAGRWTSRPGRRALDVAPCFSDLWTPVLQFDFLGVVPNSVASVPHLPPTPTPFPFRLFGFFEATPGDAPLSLGGRPASFPSHSPSDPVPDLPRLPCGALVSRRRRPRGALVPYRRQPRDALIPRRWRLTIYRIWPGLLASAPLFASKSLLLGFVLALVMCLDEGIEFIPCESIFSGAGSMSSSFHRRDFGAARMRALCSSSCLVWVFWHENE